MTIRDVDGALAFARQYGPVGAVGPWDDSETQAMADSLCLLADEVDRLRRWKAEARTVLGQWDEVWEHAGRPGLGTSKSAGVRAEIDQLRALNAVPAEGRVIPEALGDEDGEYWWLPGHVPPAMAVLAVVVEQMVNCDADQAMEVLVGGRVAAGERTSPWRHNFEDQLAAADRLVRSVKHIWVKDDPDNDERWLPAEPGDDGAEAWTEVSV